MEFRAIFENNNLDSSKPDDVLLFHYFCQLSTLPEVLILLKLDKCGINLPLDFQFLVL